VIENVQTAYREQTKAVSWRYGDLLLVDNMLVAHGRNPFEGPRAIVVAMDDRFRREDLT
jgi:hypothetical protein